MSGPACDALQVVGTCVRDVLGWFAAALRDGRSGGRALPDGARPLARRPRSRLPLRESDIVMTLLCRLRGADRHVVRRRLLLAVERAGPDHPGDPSACIGCESTRTDGWMPDYRYELRRGEVVIATGHLSREQPLRIGDPGRSGLRTAQLPPADRDVLPVTQGLKAAVPLGRPEYLPKLEVENPERVRQAQTRPAPRTGRSDPTGPARLSRLSEGFRSGEGQSWWTGWSRQSRGAGQRWSGNACWLCEQRVNSA
jgi:hypothetical protein